MAIGRDTWLGIALIILALLGAFVAVPAGIDMPADIQVRALAPNFWPLIIFGLVALAGVIIAIEGTRASGRDADGEIAAGAPVALLSEAGRFAVMIGLLAAIYWSMPYLGIVVACILAIAVLCVIGGERRIAFIAGLAVGLPVALYMFFVHVAKVPLPLGVFYDFF